jgi:hypothetical protein
MNDEINAIPTPAPSDSAVSHERAPKVPVPTDVLEARAQGRAEALAIILALDAESGLDECTYSYPIADTGEYGTGWNEDVLRELLHADDSAWSLLQETEGEFWHNVCLREDAERVLKQLRKERATLAQTAPVGEAKPIGYVNSAWVEHQRGTATIYPESHARLATFPVFATPPASREGE